MGNQNSVISNADITESQNWFCFRWSDFMGNRTIQVVSHTVAVGASVFPRSLHCCCCCCCYHRKESKKRINDGATKFI